jgi:uncharacterized protein YbjT (DUF2867 family)
MEKKVITVLGGNGYVGSKCIITLLNNVKNIKINAVSRSGKIKYPNNKFDERVNMIKGDAYDPQSFADAIKESTGIIHSIGALFTDTETYHKMNKETALRVAEIANQNKYKTNFVYISASRGMAFPLSLKYHGYIESKREAEKGLLSNFPNLNTIILRPGVVKSEEKGWTVPVYHSVNLAAAAEKLILNKIVPNIGEKLQLPTKGIDINVLARFATSGALGNLSPNEIYSNDFMNDKQNWTSLKLH